MEDKIYLLFSRSNSTKNGMQFYWEKLMQERLIAMH